MPLTRRKAQFLHALWSALAIVAILALLGIPIAFSVKAIASPETTTAPDAPQAVRIAVLAEGYLESDRDRFDEHFGRVRDAILATEPFSSERVEVVSHFRASNARLTTGERGDTAYQGYVRAGSISIGDAHARMFGDIEAAGADYAVMLFNSRVAAGSARFGVAMLTADRADAGNVALHELGHTIGGLADEYCAGTCSADWTGGQHPAPNYSAVGQPLKWQHFVMADILGPPVEGAGRYARGVYRPARNTKMRSVAQPFSPVDVAAIRVNLRAGRVHGDADCDGRVTFSDLNAVLSNFGKVGAPGALYGDINGDGVVDFRDLNEVTSHYGETR